jgi:hypothetical protein
MRRLHAARCRIVSFSSLCLLSAVLVGGVAEATEAETEEVDGTDSGSGSTTTAPDPFDGKRIYKVEEDWLLDVGETSDGSSAPEICTVFGPDDPATGVHAVYELNHATYPEFFRGGMGLQMWWGPWLVSAKRPPNETELFHTIERIQFTCRTELYSDRLKLEIANGSSLTFGTFGGTRSYRVRLYSTRENLNSYDPDMSIEQSRVTFGANRVNRYVRVAIRHYADDGTIFVDETDRVVHELAIADEVEPVNPTP